MVEEELDSTLANLAASGDLDAFGVLVRRYERQVFRIIFRMIGNYDDARDLSQQVFLKAFEHLPSYDRDRKFFSWIYRIAMNEAINHIEARRQFEPLDPESPAPGLDASERLEAMEQYSDLHEAVLALGENYRSVVVLKHFVQCSYREVADMLDIPEKTVKSRLFEARQLLRRRLEAKGRVGQA